MTDHVIDVLRRAIEYYNANPAKQNAACRRLIDPATGQGAFDIVDLSPYTSPGQDDKYHPETDTWVNSKTGEVHAPPWFTAVSNKCAIPRPQCAHTVEFLGICQHPQILNYTLWSVAMSLCGGAYNVAGDTLRYLRNIKNSIFTPESQDNAVEIARSIYDEIKNSPNNVDIAKLKKKFFDLTSIERRFGVAKDVLACRLHCELDAETKAKFSQRQFGFRWQDLNFAKPR